MEQTTYNDLIKKLRTGKTVYLINNFYGRVLKIPPGGKNYKARQKGGEEYPIKRETDLVIETMSEAVEITEKEYLSY